jgi:hypothetical protein
MRRRPNRPLPLLLPRKVDEFPSWRHHVESALALRKRTLAASLERQLADAHASGPEIRWGAAVAPVTRPRPRG